MVRDYSKELPKKYQPIPPQQTALPVQPKDEPPPAPKLSEMIDAYMQENIRAENWEERTITDYQTCVKVMLALFDDEPINRITPLQTRQFKETLMKMPPGFTRLKGYKDMSPSQLRKAPAPSKTTGTDTLNKHMAFAANVFQHALNHHYVDSNPMQGLQVKQRRKKMRDDEKTESFTPEDLLTIFNAPEYRG